MTNELFPIPLQGQGSEDIESLPSYLLRSAFKHGVSLGVFLKVIHELWPETEHIYRKGFCGRDAIVTLARVNQYSKDLREKLSQLTGQNLQCGALNFLNQQTKMLSKEIGSFYWCPECFQEMERLNIEPYIKQIWHMNAITYCPLHRTPLERKCPSCNEHQTSFRSSFNIGYCLRCGAPLSNRKEPLTPIDITPSWECLSYDIVDIFDRASAPRIDLANLGDPKSFLKGIFDSVRDKPSNHYSDDLLVMLSKCMKDWRNNSSLVSLRRLAYRLNMSLFDLLSCATNSSHQFPLFLGYKDDFPEPIKQKHRVMHNHKQEYRKFVSVIESEDPPVSLKKLAKSADVSVGYIEYRYPDLARKVVATRKNYLCKLAENNRNSARIAAINFFTDEKYSSHAQTEYQAYKILKSETGLPKWVLINAIKEAHSNLII